MHYTLSCDLPRWDDGIRFSLETETSGGLSPKVRAVVAYPHDIVFLNNRLDI